jgi:hypothetical protein
MLACFLLPLGIALAVAPLLGVADRRLRQNSASIA